MEPEVLALFVPIIGIIAGGAIAIVAIIKENRTKQLMVEKGMEIPQKKPYPYRGLRFGALLLGGAIGVLLGGIFENLHVFNDPVVGYFSFIMLFAGLGTVVSVLYIEQKMKESEA